MINNEEKQEFKSWLSHNTAYSERVVKDIICRVNRVNKFIAGKKAKYDDGLQCLEDSAEFKQLSPSVKSQCRRACKLYMKFLDANSVK